MMKKIYYLTLSLLLPCTTLLYAQQDISNLQQVDSSIIHVNGEGTFIRIGKADGTKLSLATTVQSGVQFSTLDSAASKVNTNRMSLNLVRFSLQISTLKDKVTMGILTDFTGTTPILEGWVAFSILHKHGKLILGQRQTHTNNRLAMADERYAQVMGQTIAGKSLDGTVYGGLMQNFVGSTREGGAYLETNFKMGKWKVYPSVSVTTGEGQNFFGTQNNVGLKYGGRLDVLPLGDFIKNNTFIAHDIYREKSAKLAIGVAGSYNAKASSAIGADNNTITGIYNKAGIADFANYRKIVADMIFKYQGFSFVTEYINGTISGTELYSNVAATNKLTPELASGFYNLGTAINVQSSYVSKNGLAVDIRYTNVQPEFNSLNSIVHQQNWYTLGVTKYLKHNAIKVGYNINLVEDVTTSIKKSRLTNNLAVQITL